MTKTTWRKQILHEMEERRESWGTVESCTLSDEELDVEFDAGYGGANGKPFTLWTDDRVYFPAVYDGAEWVASVPRNPNEEATAHVGGE